MLQKGKDGVCLSENNCELLHTQIKEVIKHRIVPQLLGLYRYSPANSCADIYQGHPSGNYWLNVGNEPQQIYCSLNENHCCNDSDGKWKRIAFLNMSDPSVQCPDGEREVPSPIRTCRRKVNTNIESANYSSFRIPYSRVCGRIIAYHYGTPEAFLGYNNQGQKTIEDAYVDGISITYGWKPRHHIWTFAAGDTCPCPPNGIVPPFTN